MIKGKCIAQAEKFVYWEGRKDYRAFHQSHYDWWAFPVDAPSSHGDKFQIGSEEKSQLEEDL